VISENNYGMALHVHLNKDSGARLANDSLNVSMTANGRI
jgi:hypothetical protein